MPFIEAPTTFYLGRRYNPQNQQLDDDVVYYDSRDLTTHSVVVGMTGSGKTGLCITMLEEAILDNIPAIIIDPKGDITNLLLTFPELRPQDFEPWINIDDARRAGLDVQDYSVDISNKWRDGLQSWGIVPDRLKWLQRAAQYSIYTPGSDAGLPVSILASLAAPREGWAGNEESLREKINAITTALLALIGMNAEPVKDKEHVLIANIFEHAWRQGVSLTLQDIILQVQNPPFNTLGVFPIDKYISEKARNKLSMELNSIVAAPSFQSWLNGQSLDIHRLLYQPNGRPRVSIFYIAHLSEAERMFIITLILENMLGWMRTLSGTTSLRALLYVDEMFGYFPPYPKNPPTKEPILRLLKQARAFGLGLILATQNPGDLDYKGLSNAGTWFIGRLQSEQDKDRVIAGLRSMSTAQDGMNLQQVEDMISDIAPRVFLMRNVHDPDGPILLHTRWAMNYLRGPLTRQQVQTLMAAQRQQIAAQIAQPAPVLAQPANGGFAAQSAAPVPVTPMRSTAPMTLPGTTPPSMPERVPGFTAPIVPQTPPPLPVPMSAPIRPQVMPDSQRLAVPQTAAPGYSSNRAVLPASTAQFYLPNTVTVQQAIVTWEQQMRVRAQLSGTPALAYEPVLLAQGTVRYQDKKASIYTARTYAYQVPDVQRAGIIHWEEHLVPPIDSRTISSEPSPLGSVLFGDIPPGLTDQQRMTALKREITDMLYNTARLRIPHNPSLGVYANPDTDFSHFQSQAAQIAREERDKELDKTSQKYAAQMEKLEAKLKGKEQELDAEKKELSDRRREELYTTGEALLSIWRGQTNYTLSRMSRATRFRRQTKDDLAESHSTISELEVQMDELQREFEQVLRTINDKWAQIATQTTDYIVSPYKKDITLELFGIGWVPYWYSVINGQGTLLPAYAS
jgi:Skp family chaperone for outer membrane proteins